MCEDRSLQIETNHVQSLSLCFVDCHRKARPDGELFPDHDEWEIGVPQVERYPGQEDCDPFAAASDHLTFYHACTKGFDEHSCAIPEAFLWARLQISEEHDDDIGLQFQLVRWHA